MIPFNKPYLTGKELIYIQKAIDSGKISGDGMYTKKCQSFFESHYGFQKCLLTTSCTDALELAALLLNIQQGDEIIMPSFTFVSTANAFVLRGAKIVFVDSRQDHPGLNENEIEKLITNKTKVIVVVHYAGVATDMDAVMKIANIYNLFVVEDAAQAIDSYYKNKPLGSFGNLATFSFHETKNIQCGEGGMLVINDIRFNERAEILREKGTNRAAFFRGEVNKYGWVDCGSSFLPSEITAAFLFAQLENINEIENRRIAIWNQYRDELLLLEDKGLISLPNIPNYASNNAHMFYIVLKDLKSRLKLIDFLKEKNILSVFHYISLHSSPFYKLKHDGRKLPLSDSYSDTLLRLPLFFDLSDHEIKKIIQEIKFFFLC
jgi:dTDP-4-amino-4,6-dideoxygalactose transaminase